MGRRFEMYLSESDVGIAESLAAREGISLAQVFKRGLRKLHNENA